MKTYRFEISTNFCAEDDISARERARIFLELWGVDEWNDIKKKLQEVYKDKTPRNVKVKDE